MIVLYFCHKWQQQVGTDGERAREFGWGEERIRGKEMKEKREGSRRKGKAGAGGKRPFAMPTAKFFKL